MAEDSGVEMHLVTSLDVTALAGLLARIPHPQLWVTYDTGNSAALGYDVLKEFNAYGDRIGSVHIKDRLRGGVSVLLGCGSTDFPALAEGLRMRFHPIPLILEVARATPGEEVQAAINNRRFVAKVLQSPAVKRAE